MGERTRLYVLIHANYSSDRKKYKNAGLHNNANFIVLKDMCVPNVALHRCATQAVDLLQCILISKTRSIRSLPR